ncbi:MAG: flippase [Clostridia bacterium]|nr:flippase [Clostridia bacterium]
MIEEKPAAMRTKKQASRKRQIVSNAAWMIGCKVFQALLGVVITMLTARYLGPSNFGIINYASSLVAFVAPIGMLGLDSILVNELVSHPEREGETVGTAMIMSLFSSLLCIAGLAGFIAVANPGEGMTLIVCILYSVVLFAYAIELMQYWFQAHLLSKYPSIAMLIAYFVKSVYQAVLLVNGSNLYWFALSSALDVFVIDAFICIQYRRMTHQKLSWSYAAAKRMFAQSKHYIVSSMMVTIFANTDRIMIKMMLGDSQTGFYSAAVACASLTSFVFSSIMYSVRPVILEKHKNRDAGFDQWITALYSIIIYLSLLQCIFISCFAPIIISILYGADYTAAVDPLRWIVWYTTFSYLGTVRNIWIVANKKQSLLWKVNLTGAVGNVLLNAIMIPVMGISGAAIASLLTQIITNVVLCFVFDELKPTTRYLKDSLNLVKCLKMLRTLA